MKILVIHGPNLNMLGEREVNIYGKVSLGEIDQALKNKAEAFRVELETFQSNHEGELVEKIQQAKGKFDAIILNPAAFTHYSIALRDVVAAVEVPIIEVHLSNIYSREDWRASSVISPVAMGVISGFGMDSYLLGLDAAVGIVKGKGKGTKAGT